MIDLNKYSSTTLSFINSLNNIFCNALTNEDRVDANKTLGVLLYRKLCNEGILTPTSTQVEKLAAYNNALDIAREVLHIDATILKNSLIESDTILSNKSLNKIAIGEISIYPTLPSRFLKDINVFAHCVEVLFTKEETQIEVE